MDASFDPRTEPGRDAVSMVLALVDAGQDVVVRPAALSAPLPRKFTDLLSKDPAGEADLALSMGAVLDGFRANCRVSAVWDSHPGQAQCDMVLATDPDSVVFLREHARREHVEYLPHGIDAEVWPEIDREGQIAVGVVSGGDRVLRHWRDDVDANLLLMPEGMNQRERLEFYGAVDLMVSLTPDRHTGRTMKEFMATGGVPVIVVAGETRNVWNPDSCFEVGLEGSGLDALFARLGGIRAELNRMGHVGRRQAVSEFHWPNLIERMLTKTGRLM